MLKDSVILRSVQVFCIWKRMKWGIGESSFDLASVPCLVSSSPSVGSEISASLASAANFCCNFALHLFLPELEIDLVGTFFRMRAVSWKGIVTSYIQRSISCPAECNTYPLKSIITSMISEPILCAITNFWCQIFQRIFHGSLYVLGIIHTSTESI